MPKTADNSSSNSALRMAASFQIKRCGWKRPTGVLSGCVPSSEAAVGITPGHGKQRAYSTPDSICWTQISGAGCRKLRWGWLAGALGGGLGGLSGRWAGGRFGLRRRHIIKDAPTGIAGDHAVIGADFIEGLRTQHHVAGGAFAVLVNLRDPALAQRLDAVVIRDHVGRNLRAQQVAPRRPLGQLLLVFLGAGARFGFFLLDLRHFLLQF